MKVYPEPTCNLLYHQCNPVIPKGCYKCKVCKGTGIIVKHIQYIKRHIHCTVCPACDGTGFMDWIDFTLNKNLKLLYNIRFNNHPNRFIYKYYDVELNFRCPTNKKCKVIKNMCKAYNQKLKYAKKKERAWLVQI